MSPSPTSAPTDTLPDPTSAMGWRFDTTYTRLPEMFFRQQAPVTVQAPQMVIFNRGLAMELGLDPDALDEDQAAAVFSGNKLPQGATPLAQAYAGHQFGGFTMLGDGRALLLGEHLDPQGRRWDIQYKGSGPTPFSRRGDGRAALGPMLREFIISEGMHFLGIPTTRSLAVTATGEPVYRESVLAGAVLTRVASSHIRVGTFEYAAAAKEGIGLPDLAAYTLGRHDPDATDSASPALTLLQRVIARQCALIVEWMRVGFIHGVMNTDNMTLSGETIDYGPCAFLDRYDPATVFSSIDQYGRYAFGKQAMMAQWNLARFAESLLPLLAQNRDHAVQQAQDAVMGFKDRFEASWQAMMGRKLGMITTEDGDESRIQTLLTWMQQTQADYTQTFRALTDGLNPEGPTQAPSPALNEGLSEWHRDWLSRLDRQDGGQKAAFAVMTITNPVYIPRNHQVEAALSAAADEGNLGPTHHLLNVLAAPYTRRPGLEDYEAPPASGGPAYRTFCGT